MGSSSEWIYSPPAVAAAVIAWAGEVRAWMNRKGKGHNITLYPDDESETWGWDCWISCELNQCGSEPSQLAASLALISAVAEGLEEA